jgi:hypothetical protein
MIGKAAVLVCILASVTAVSDAATITGFTPSSGVAGTNVIIQGSGFTGASAVKFNGTNASFSINSSSEIAAVAPAIALDRVADELGQARAALHGIVHVELDLRRDAQPHLVAHLVTQEARRVLQRLACGLGIAAAGKGREVDVRVRQVAGDFHGRDRDEPDARVLDFSADQLREQALQLLLDAARPRELARHIEPRLRRRAGAQPRYARSTRSGP